ncbi:hypothetical protein E2562_006877 [Oryza meyeriana var. granulata]|uniref:DUF6598 domain-containing protein n=1 Tax=Oryza meyeriana var. granulata TaxID=110450 RepID=A0A6G1C4U5_9ORYZ|nr:hypothetical protein E2562_006877 [Oryza meyeriana var. granulata]
MLEDPGPLNPLPPPPRRAQMRILRPIRRLPRHPNAATSPAPMHRLSSSSRPVLSFMASAAPRWWSPLPTRGVSPLLVSLSPPVRRISRFPWDPRNMSTISRVKGDESGKPYGRRPAISSANVIVPSQEKKHTAITQGMKNIDTRGTSSEVIGGDERSDKDEAASEVIYVKYDILGQIVKHNGCGEEDRRSETEEHWGGIVVSDNKEVTVDEEFEEYAATGILPQSRHRDGSIYRGMDLWWKKDYLIGDRNETRLEAMMLSNPTNCIIDDGACMKHLPRNMLQILSIELAKTPVDGGLVELYGYIAVRDELDLLLNYVVNFSRDDPIIVEQGSLINMTGPKRGIVMMDSTLIEYDMRIKTGKQEKDLQLIDGASIIAFLRQL